MLKQIRTANITDNFLSFQVPPGKYHSFVFEFKGTNAAGETTTIDKFGYARLLVEGREYQRIDFERLSDINNLKGGVASEVSAIGAGFDMMVELPQAVYGDLMNVLHVTDVDNIVLELNDFYDVTEHAAGAVYVYGVLAPQGEQYYYLKLGQHDFNCVQGLTVHKLQGWENCWELFIENDTALDRLGVFVDGDTQVNALREALYGYTQIINEVETWSATTTLLDILLAPTGTLNESLSEDVILQPEFSAPGALQVVILSIDFAPDKLGISRTDAALRQQAKLAKKSSYGKTRPIAVLGAG